MSHDGSTPKRRPDPEGRIIGTRLKAVRQSVPMTQKDMADRLGMSAGGYSSIERGHARMFVTDIPRFARALGIEPAYLAQRLGLCGEDRADIATALVNNFGPRLGQTLVRLDRILAFMQHDDTAALDVTVRRYVEPYESESRA